MACSESKSVGASRNGWCSVAFSVAKKAVGASVRLYRVRIEWACRASDRIYLIESSFMVSRDCVRLNRLMAWISCVLRCCGCAMMALGGILGLLLAAIAWHDGSIGICSIMEQLLHDGAVDVGAFIRAVVLSDCSGGLVPSFDPDVTFAWSAEFRQEWRHMLEELYQWERNGSFIPTFDQVDPRQDYLNTEGTWSTLWLKAYGRNTEAAARFPKTMELLDRTTVTSVFFSILGKGKEVDMHRGDNKAVLRYLLALEVPKPSRGQTEESEPLALHVADKFYYVDGEEMSFSEHRYIEGDAVVFDDTF